MLIDTGATACYIKSGIFLNKNELPIHKRVSTVNGYSIIKYYQIIKMFNIKHIFYEIEGLETDLLVGYNLLKKIGAIIDTKKGVICYHGERGKINFS